MLNSFESQSCTLRYVAESQSWQAAIVWNGSFYQARFEQRWQRVDFLYHAAMAQLGGADRFYNSGAITYRVGVADLAEVESFMTSAGIPISYG